MKTQQTLVTPEMASQLLLQNTGNRTVRANVVSRYSDDMKNGSWGLSHQGIAVDVNGNLIDGQHRLLAVVKSGAAVPMLVTTGLQPEIFEVIDKLSARSDADSLRMRQKNVEVFKMLASVHTGKTKPSLSALKECITAFSPTYEALSFSSCNTKTFSSASVRTAAIIAATEKPDNTEVIAKSYSDMLHGNMDGLSISFRSLVRSVYNGTVKTTGGGAARTEMMQRFFTAFCMDNTELTKIYPTNIERIKKIVITKMDKYV